jgi:hypothetical protein
LRLHTFMRLQGRGAKRIVRNPRLRLPANGPFRWSPRPVHFVQELSLRDLVLYVLGKRKMECMQTVRALCRLLGKKAGDRSNIARKDPSGTINGIRRKIVCR